MGSGRLPKGEGERRGEEEAALKRVGKADAQPASQAKPVDSSSPRVNYHPEKKKQKGPTAAGANLAFFRKI